MISVVIPTHKRADLLFYELEHIYMQKDADFEVIVVNDIEEEDETDAIREKFPDVIYIKDSKIQGPSNKHKAGLKIAQGEYLYMPDDDDYLTDEYFFKKAVSYMEQYPKVGFISGGVNILYQFSDGRPDKIKRQFMNVSGYIDGAEYLQEFQNKLQKPASTVSTLFRRQSFMDLKMIDMQEMSDSSMYMVALLWGDAYVFDDVVANYRVKGYGTSLTTTLSIPFIINVLEQKEELYLLSKKRISNSKKFWYNQVKCTLNMIVYSNNSIAEKISIIRWGLTHTHGVNLIYTKMLSLFLRITSIEIYKCFKSNY